MFELYKKSIKGKLLFAFGTVLILSFLLAALGYYSINKILENKDLTQRIDNISMQVLNLRKSEKDFLMRSTVDKKFYDTHQSEYLNNINAISQQLIVDLEALKLHPAAEPLELDDEFDAMGEIITEYNQILNSMVEVYVERGYDDWGYEGKFRHAAHGIENLTFPYDRTLLLLLRRYEKDFIMRKDLKYQDEVRETIHVFRDSVETANNVNADPRFSEKQTAIIGFLEDFQKNFDLYVGLQQKLGRDDNSGLLGDLKAAVEAMEPIMADLENKIHEKTSNISRNTILLFILVFIAQLIVGIMISIKFSNKLTANIKKIKDGIVTLSEGTFPEKVEINSEDELAATQAATNNLIERIRTAAAFTQNIGEGRLDEQYDERYSNDVLAKALQDMHNKLKEVAAEDAKRTWAAKGLAEFGELIRNNEKDLKLLCYRIISDLVKFVNANQGKIFVINDEDTQNYDGSPYLELMATYAWKREKFQTQVILKGEGLPGQSWYERKTIHIREIPEGYIKITSGLGEAVPRSILIVPLIVNEQVYGIIELASFETFEEYKIKFIEKLAEIIAASLSSVRINEKTKELLEQSQQQSEEMRAQEEEMRQNMEELSATQEEMVRKEREYLKRIEDLESQVAEQENS